MSQQIPTCRVAASVATALLFLVVLATCSKDEIKKGRGGGGVTSISLTVPLPAGNGLLDGSGDLSKATQPIIDMTSCTGNEVSIIPARMVRLTIGQLYNAMTFHSKVTLASNDFLETFNSTTNFSENSYALQGTENFTRLVDTQAEKIASSIDFNQLIGCEAAAFSQNQPCQDNFFNNFVARVLNTDDLATLTAIKNLYSSLASDGAEAALRSVTRLVFQHPLFLYRQEIGQGANGELNSFELAQMVSYIVTDRPPDDALWQLAKNKQLSQSNLSTEIDRLLANTEIRADLSKRFFRPYLGIRSVQSAQAQQIESSFTDFITTTPMGKIFESASDSDNRIGIHTHKLYIASHAKDNGDISPIHSGIAIRSDLLCQKIAPPPGAFPPIANALEGINAREGNPSCARCHQYMDPMGQNYLDYNGQGIPVENKSGKESIITATIDFDDTYPSMTELSLAMAGSEHLKRCMALQVYRFTFARPEQIGESCHISEIYKGINQEQISFEDLVKKALLYTGNLKRR